MTIDDWNESIRAELPEMIRQGVTSFKMYMTYPAMMVGDRDMYWALKELRHLGGICGVHCENAGVIDGMIAEKKAAGLLGPSSHPESRPPYLEAEAVGRLLRIAQAADCPVVIVHLTNEDALKEVEHARKRGQKVYVETCPQYLLLDESVYYNPDYSQAARYVCAPPIREKANQEVLWRGCAGAKSRPSPPITAPSRWHRRTQVGMISRRSPAGCPAWRPAASWSIPTGSPQKKSLLPRCAGF